jgi:Leucine-rich repeat (LRR) protein
LISNHIFAQWSIPNVERDALISIYNSTNGIGWSQTWDFSKDPRNWYGIRTRNGNIIEINLRGNALKGDFPAIFSAFSKLQKLDLSSNQLSGEVSASVSGLADLVRLDISNNNLSGDPTSFLASLSQLEELSLGNNQFSAANIDAFLQNFSNVKVLDLANFGLTAVPQNIPNKPNLEILNLSNNTISQNFNNLSGLSNLSELNLSGNQLTQIPPEFSSLTNLKVLNLSNNLFANNYSAPLSALVNLEWLSLENNQISVFPAELSQLTKLIHLNFGRNKISGGLSSLLVLTNLQQLFLNNNLFQGGFPSELTQFSKLQMLSLASNNFSGEIPANTPSLTFIENNRFNQTQIDNFLQQNLVKADFTYSPQRYDSAEQVLGIIGNSADLTQSLSGTDYQFTWLKNLDENTGVHTETYHINNVQNEDFATYTCEAYYFKNNPNYRMEVAFFREPITLVEQLGTDDEILKDLNIYPNPTKDFLNILSKNYKIEEVYIYDLSGKLMISNNKTQINVRNLPSGAYIISIKTNAGIKNFKFIKY